ncbi:MAG TPA: hypothetical protein VF015_00115 [Acidimicrobiales bacterium]
MLVFTQSDGHLEAALDQLLRGRRPRHAAAEHGDRIAGGRRGSQAAE